MPGISDTIERVNQGVLLLGFECNVEVDRGASELRAQAPTSTGVVRSPSDSAARTERTEKR